MAHALLQENGVPQLRFLSTVVQERGLWTNSTLHSILNNETPSGEKLYEFLSREGPDLLQMRVKFLIKENLMDKAALLAKACADFPAFDGRRVQFKQIYLVCLCTVAPQQTLMDELSTVDCQDALEMICNLEADGDEKGAFTLCSGFLSRQLLQEDSYCAWELTLFWSKLLKRLEHSEEGFLERCRQMSRLAKTVFHLLFFIKVIQSELDKTGLPSCIEMCIRALQMESCEGANKATICKTISCLLPADLEVKRACQLTEFLLEPTVDSYYAVETLYNEPDQKIEAENLPIPNSLRCELLLVFKTQWPFDPEFWDWKTLKRHCLGLMGEEASIVSSIDELNDEHPEDPDSLGLPQEFKDVSEYFLDATNELKEIEDQKQKNREIKKLREKGFVSARFRNWQAYMQYCVLCDKEFLGHRIVRHAQTHFKDGNYSCPICLETFETRETLDPHVATHVKSSCKERLAAMKTSKKLANEKAATPACTTLKAKSAENQARKTKAKNRYNGEFDSVHNGDTVENGVAGIKPEGREGNVCPVPHCRKGFKYFRNLIAHVKDHGEVEEAKRFLEMQSTKIVCQYCRRHFVNVNHLNDHLQVHCGTKPYICIQLNCKASFDSNAELLIHRKDHPVFKAKCMFPGCGKIFSEAFKLYDHEAQHYKTFTCKVPGCGKVFHAQSQLDLHEEGHNKKEEAQNTEGQGVPKAEPLPDDSSDAAKEGVEQDTLAEQPLHSSGSLSPLSHPINLVKVKHSVENMLSSVDPGSTQSFDPGTQKTEPPDPNPIQPQIPQIDNQLIHPTVNPMPPLNEPRSEDSLLDALMSDPMLAAPCPDPPASSYQNVIEDYPPAPSRDDLQGQMQTAVPQTQNLPLYNNGNAEYQHYSPNPVGQIQAQYQAPYGNNMPSLPQSTCNSNMAMPVSQRLPPQVTPFPTNMQVSDSRPTQPLPSNSLGPATEEKEKFKCAYENCSREYCSHRSLTKHMKATHPEFYTQWKLARKNSRMHQSASAPMSMNGKPNSAAPLPNQLGQRIPPPATQMQSPGGRPTYPASCPSSSYPTATSHLPAQTGQPFPNQMESILDPIVLSQLGNNSDKSQIALEPSWNSVPVNKSLQQRTCHSQAMTSNMDVLSGNHYSTPVNAVPQSQRTDAQPHGMVYPLQPQSNLSCNFIPSQTDAPQNLKNPPLTGHSINSSTPSYTQQPKSNPVSFPKPTECSVKMERNPKFNLPPPDSSQHNTSSTVENSKVLPDEGGSDANGGDVKKVKRSRRTKWPAIIRDGKFICCRCFREFQSPKSLGGHLSKRAHCKGFDEADLSADLPTSFLDLLNSPVGTPQPTSSLHMNANQPFHIVNKGPLDPKLYPNVTFLHGKDSSRASNSKQSTEVIKQNSASLCETSGLGQQSFNNAPASYPQDGQSSVIQHTGNIKENLNQHQMGYTQPCNPSYMDNDLPDPLLSRLLGEDNPSPSFNRVPTDHIDKILHNETLNKMKEIKEKTTIVNASGLSNDGLLAAMASLAQNLVSEKSVKEKLREQILAGDYHRKSSTSQGVDNVNLQNPVPSSPAACGPPQSTHVIQRIPPIDLHHFGNAANLHSESLVIAGIANATPKDGSTQISSASVPTISDINKETTNSPIHQDDEMTQIQKALERLDLDKEVSEQKQVTPELPKNPDLAKTSDGANSTGEVLGFTCSSNSCGYRAMTRDALFKHLIKLHNYTEEMLNQYRKDQVKLAPFTCQVCFKNFTRNSNLKVHYQSVHSYTQEQIAQLRMKAQYPRRSVDNDGSPCPTPNNTDLRNRNDSPKTIQKAVSEGGQPLHIHGAGLKGLVPVDGRIKSEGSVRPSVQQPRVGILDASLPGSMQTALPTPSQSQAVTHPSVIKSGPSMITSLNMEQQLNVQYTPRPSVPSQSMPGMPPGGSLPPRVPLNPTAQNPAVSGLTGLTLDKKPKLGRPKLAKPSTPVPKKPKEKKTDIDDVFSPYRPYRCVHQGCVAAFTIQQNLILHYKAVHQSELPKFEANSDEEQKEEEEENQDDEEQDIHDVEVTEVSEFRCQVKDCSRIFLVATDLLQHYLQLHKLGIDKAGAMMSTMKLGRFQCDQPNCTTTFTAIWKYVNHVEKEHKDVKRSKQEPVEGVFQCEVEGCDCTYSTRSNLLRHTMKKHQELYKLQLMTSKGVRLGRPRKHPYPFLEKENREVNKKPEKKVDEKKVDGKKLDEKKMDEKKVEEKRVSEKKLGEKKKRAERNNHWTKYGKPILKTKEEASAICTKRFPLQYPCMIKGCETVASSERNIIKHYVQHGLPKQYLEEQRSNYIHCKKLPRSKYKRITSRSDDTDKSEDSSVEISENEEAVDTAQSESEFSKPASEKESTEDAKPSTDTSSDVSVVVKRKRGRPRKTLNRSKPFAHKRVTRLRTSHSFPVNYADINSDSTSSSVALPPEDSSEQKSANLSTFKPMGFEVSFLQFLEQSSQPVEKRKASVTLDTGPCKKLATVKLKTASVVCSRSDILKLVEFKNPQKLTSLGNVTFEVHRSFSNVFELLLKQLHEMRPAVVIQKDGLSVSL
ncbi:zinc finger protein 292b isoform X2 [Hoplias malabaricus]